jgi:myo-inositol-1(or 4)-monophosphatase
VINTAAHVKHTAFKAAHEAGLILFEHLGKIKEIEYKSAFNIVTDVDKASEMRILAILQEEFPGDDILAEESGKKDTGAKRRWLIDPLDGTTNYTHSYPFFAVSIALEDNGTIVFGVVHNPFTKETFWAEKGGGAYLNESSLTVSANKTLSTSLLATGFPPGDRKPEESNMLEFAQITASCHGVRRDGAAALDLSYVAAGRLDGFWETKLAPWDMAAGLLIVQEAGGKVTNDQGLPLDLTKGHILATNGLIHDEVVQALNTVRQKKSASNLKL